MEGYAVWFAGGILSTHAGHELRYDAGLDAGLGGPEESAAHRRASNRRTRGPRASPSVGGGLHGRPPLLQSEPGATFTGRSGGLSYPAPRGALCESLEMRVWAQRARLPRASCVGGRGGGGPAQGFGRSRLADAYFQRRPPPFRGTLQLLSPLRGVLRRHCCAAHSVMRPALTLVLGTGGAAKLRKTERVSDDGPGATHIRFAPALGPYDGCQ